MTDTATEPSTPTGEGSVLMGIICRETARYSETFSSIMGLARPEGSEFSMYRGYNTPMGWNEMARTLLKSKHEYLFTMNDDHVYPPDTITKLMARKVQCVSGLYLLRQYPFEPVAYDYVDNEGRMGHHFLENNSTGIIPIKVVGDGCLLTHRSVFETVPDPWYVLNGPPAPPDQINCDVLFCRKLREHGVNIYLDLDVRIGHIHPVAIFPNQVAGVWQTDMLQGNGLAISVPAATAGARQKAEAEAARDRQLAEAKAGK